MKYLLDTHIFIWAMEDSARLQPDIKEKIRNPENEIFVSIATIWEISIKRSLKKLKVPFDVEVAIENTGLQLLPIKLTHALGIEKVPIFHKDPFDKMLISQAKIENLPLITSDKRIWKYKVKLIKA